MDDDEKNDATYTGRRPKNRVPKLPVPTWAEAAKKVGHFFYLGHCILNLRNVSGKP